MPSPGTERRRTIGVGAVVGLVALLPFVRGLLAGGCFYFRDLSLHFFPLRRLVLEGLRHGDLRFWNPYVQEGVPLTIPPLSYPFDLLQALAPTERGLTLFLIAHVPLAAVAFMALARGLGLGRPAAAAGALVYALGGFTLSSVNLYHSLLAVAWAPLLVLALLRAAEGERRALAVAALVSAIALTTGGVEVVVQTLVVAFVLAATNGGLSSRVRQGAAVALGAGLAAYALLPAAGLLAGTARAAGFAAEVVTAHSVHPVTLLQVMVAGLYGEPWRLTERWWGQNFFPRGFPYLVSLYLGPSVLALAALGAWQGRVLRRRLLLLAIAAAILSLGTFVGLDALVAAVPVPRIFRYPSKAFFTVHLAVALLAALGLDSLERPQGAARLSRLAFVFGSMLLATTLLPLFMSGTFRWLVAGFFPPEMPWPARLARASLVLSDAALGGVFACLVGVVAAGLAADSLSPRLAGTALVALAAGDLLRAGAGLNPMVSAVFYAQTSEVLDRDPELRSGRIFTCGIAESPEYLLARAARGEDHEVWTFATLAETLTPGFNVPWRVSTAYSEDLTMAVPLTRVLPIEDATCRSFPEIRERLRQAGVSHVLSLAPLEDPALAAEGAYAPPRIAPLVVHVYALRDAKPRRFVASEVQIGVGPDLGPSGVRLEPGAGAPTSGAVGRVWGTREGNDWLELEAEADRPTVVVVRDGWAPGWKATVDGHAAPLLLADGRHRAVPIGAGRHRVSLRYEPPSGRRSLLITGASVLLVAGLFAPPRRSAA